MALELFRVSGGFQIDESTQILEGAVAPTQDAPVGSLYTLTTDGTLYTKIAAGSGADKWSAIAGTDGVLALLAAETTARQAADTVLQNNINTETTLRIAGDTILQADIGAEATIRANADTTLQNNINAEATLRANADTTLQTNIDTETTARIAGDAAQAAALATEVTARTNADTTLQNNINTEVTARIAADQALNDRIDALGNAFNYVGVLTGGASAGTATDLTALPAEGKNPGDYYKVTTAGYFNDGTTTFFKNVGDGLVWNLYGQMDSIDNTNSQVQGTTNEISVTGTTDTGYVVALDAAFSGRVTTVETGLAAEITNRTAADGVLQTAIDAEVTARTAAVAAEASARTAADTTLQANIDAETTARIAGDATNAAAIAAETTARIAADATLQAAIDAEITARTAGDATNAAAILAETTARTAADVVLQAAIDAEITARTAADTAEASARAAADTVLTNNLATLNTFVQRDGKVTTADAVQVLADTVDIPVSAVQWIVHVQNAADTTKVSAYEVFAASNGVTVDFTRFGLLKLNSGVAGVAVTATLNGAYGIDLSVTTTADANIKIKRVAVV